MKVRITHKDGELTQLGAAFYAFLSFRARYFGSIDGSKAGRQAYKAMQNAEEHLARCVTAANTRVFLAHMSAIDDVWDAIDGGHGDITERPSWSVLQGEGL